MSAFESAVIDAKFDGYLSDFGSQRAAVLLGKHSVEPTYLGTGKQSGEVSQSKPTQETDVDRVDKARTLPAGQMTGADWKRMIPAVVPGADVSMLEDGRIYYKSDVVGAMRGGKFSPRRIMVDGIERPTENSLGQPIHATEEGIRSFWRWFGGDSTQLANQTHLANTVLHNFLAPTFLAMITGIPELSTCLRQPRSVPTNRTSSYQSPVRHN